MFWKVLPPAWPLRSVKITLLQNLLARFWCICLICPIHEKCNAGIPKKTIDKVLNNFGMTPPTHNGLTTFSDTQTNLVFAGILIGRPQRSQIDGCPCADGFKQLERLQSPEERARELREIFANFLFEKFLNICTNNYSSKGPISDE